VVPLKIFRKNGYKRRVGFKSIKEQLIKAGIQFLIIFNIHMLLYYWFEDTTLFLSFWHTFTIVTTVGFGDISASTVGGKWTTIIFGFSLGIWLLANFVSVLIDFKRERQRQQRIGNWEWKLIKPIVLIGSPLNNGEAYFTGLLKQIRNTAKLKDKDILIVSQQFPDGLPEALSDLGAVLLNKKADDNDLYKDKNIINAEIIYIIAKEEFNSVSNAVTFNTLSLLKDSNISTHIIAETTKGCDRNRFIAAGATAVIKPMRAYPKMVVRAMVDKHNAIFIENMFSSRGDEPIVFDIDYSGTWKNIVMKCLEQDIGTPVGYVNSEDKLIGNPSANIHIDAKGIQILVKDHDLLKGDKINFCLRS
jgi:voltage-gated potassium channel